MPQGKQASKQKRVAKAAVPALGAAGLSVGLVGGAFASATPTADVPQKLNFAPTQAVTLDEEEMADVTLATFHLFDKENNGSALQQMALPVRRLSSLPCLRSAWLRVRWLRGLRRLLPIVGAVPLVLS